MTLKFNKNDMFDIVKAVVFSILLSVFAVMLFALVVKFTNIGDKFIAPINIGVKILSIALGCLLGIKNGKYGILKGIVVGVFFALITYLIFSLINKSFALNSMTVYDIISCVVAGLISGIFSVNIRKTKD